MAKKRVGISNAVKPQSTTSLFKSTAPPAEERPKQDHKERTKQRAAYDMTPELKTAVQQRANELGISASQLAMFLLSDALERFDGGEIDPRPYLGAATSPKYRHSLEFGDWYKQ